MSLKRREMYHCSSRLRLKREASSTVLAAWDWKERNILLSEVYYMSEMDERNILLFRATRYWRERNIFQFELSETEEREICYCSELPETEEGEIHSCSSCPRLKRENYTTVSSCPILTREKYAPFRAVRDWGERNMLLFRVAWDWRGRNILLFELSKTEEREIYYCSNYPRLKSDKRERTILPFELPEYTES